MAAPLAAQDINAHKPEKGHISDTVLDVNNDTVSGATVVFEGSDLRGSRTVLSDDNGFFDFDNLDPGTYSSPSAPRDLRPGLHPP
jgi:protocatechuate 3,4-dioxygenase beta subunit